MLSIGGLPLQANLVQNGGFESPMAVGESDLPTGWTVSSNLNSPGLYQQGKFLGANATQGSQALDLGLAGWGVGNTIAQTLPAARGMACQVSFDWGSEYGWGTKAWVRILDANSKAVVAERPLDEAARVPPPTIEDVPWIKHRESFMFIAPGPVILEFGQAAAGDVNVDFGGLVLDNVEVVTNLVQNGGFESPAALGESDLPTGWTVFINLDSPGLYKQGKFLGANATQGSQALDLGLVGWGVGNAVSQTFPTSRGMSCQVAFDWGSEYGWGTKAWVRILEAGSKAVVMERPLHEAARVPPGTVGDAPWIKHRESFVFSAPGPVILEFQQTPSGDINVDYGGLVLDNVEFVVLPIRTFTVAASASTGGSVQLSPMKSNFDEGEQVTLTAVPAPGYRFVRWMGNASGSINPLAMVVDSDKIITAHFERVMTLTVNITGQGTVVRNPAGDGSYAAGALVELTAQAEANWQFAGWNGAVSGTSPTVTITMDSDKAVTALFKPEFSITITVEGRGAVNLNPNKARYLEGDQVTVTAVPDNGFRFKEWANDLSGSVTPSSLVVNGNRSVIARFVQSWTVTTRSTEGGTVTPQFTDQVFDLGSAVVLTATPLAGYRFTGWSGSGTGTNNPLNVAVDGHKTITAQFEKIWTLTLNTTGQGTVTRNPPPLDSGHYAHGTQVELTAQPAPGWQFSGWGGAATSTEVRTTLGMDGDKTATATFVQVFTIQTLTEGSGSIEITPQKSSYLAGEQVTLTASAAPGHRFGGWTGDMTSSESSLVITISRSMEVRAIFTAIPAWKVNVAAAEGGSVEAVPLLENYPDGTSVGFTAKPAPGYVFLRWGGDSEATTNPLNLPITRDTSLQAIFRDVEPPSVIILSPAAGTLDSEVYSLTATATDNGKVAGVQWQVNEGTARELTSSNEVFLATNLKLSPGDNLIKVTARDLAGNESSGQVLVQWTPQRIVRLAETAEVQEGQRITIPLELTSKGEVAGIDFEVRYESDYLAEPVLEWGSASSLGSVFANVSRIGSIKGSVVVPGGTLPSGQVVVATLGFRARSVPKDRHAVPLTLQVNSLSAADSVPITYGTEVAGRQVIITQRRIKGDANGNSKLDVGDAKRMQMLLVGLDELRDWDRIVNDVAGEDGNLTIADVLRVMEVAARIRPQPTLQAAASGRPAISPRSLRMPALLAPVEAVRLRASSQAQQPGDLQVVEILLEQITNSASAAEFTIQYPASALRLESSQDLVAGEIIPAKGSGGSVEVVWNVVPSNNYAQQQGVAHFAASSAASWPKKDGVLAKLTFRAQPEFFQRDGWVLKVDDATVTSSGYELRKLQGDELIMSSGMTTEMRLSELHFSGDTLSFSSPAQIGGIYALERSTNLVHWSPVQQIQAAQPTLLFSIPVDSIQGSAFFRIKSLP